MGSENRTYDVVIIGGGPAGISAAMWCADLGLDSIMLEREAECGGALLRVYNPILNYPGIVTRDGRELRDHFLQSCKDLNFERRTSAEIVSANLAEKIVTLADGERIAGNSIVIGTGTRRRQLGIPGEKEFQGRGILDSGVKHKTEVSGKHVVIVGGGDAAVENALILSETAEKITLVHRKEKLSARDEFLDRLAARPNIDLKLSSILTAIRGNENVEAVELAAASSANVGTERIEMDNILIRIGVEPNTDNFRGQIDLDAKGYILTDRNSATNLANIYAIGDVANPRSPSVATAIGTGATAIKHLKT